MFLMILKRQKFFQSPKINRKLKATSFVKRLLFFSYILYQKCGTITGAYIIRQNLINFDTYNIISLPAKNVTKGNITMTLVELSKEYLVEEEKLTKQIDALREKSKNYRGSDKHMANRHLCCLYEMRREVHNTAEILANYYTNKTTRRIYHKKLQ